MSSPSRLVRISPTPKPLTFEAPSTYPTHWPFGSSSIELLPSNSPSRIVHSITKSTNTCAFIKSLEWNARSNSMISRAYLAILSNVSDRCRVAQHGWSVCELENRDNFLAKIIRAKMSFSNQIYLVSTFCKTQLTYYTGLWIQSLDKNRADSQRRDRQV